MLTILATPPYSTHPHTKQPVTMAHSISKFTQYISETHQTQHSSETLNSYIYSAPTLQERLLQGPCITRSNVDLKKQLQEIDKVMSPPQLAPRMSVPPKAPRLTLYQSFETEIYPNWGSGKYALSKQQYETRNLIAIPAI
jgi:hypothetical protein